MSELREECYKCLNNQSCPGLADYGSIICMNKRKFKMPSNEDDSVYAIKFAVMQQQIDEKDRAIEKLKKHNKELLRKLRNRVKEIKKLNKYNLYKKEFKTLNEQLKKKDEIIEKLEKEAQKYFEEIIKQDRTIHLMAETIRKLAISLANYRGSYNEETFNFTGNIKDIKQYFESK